jgi:hypothetical protein
MSFLSVHLNGRDRLLRDGRLWNWAVHFKTCVHLWLLHLTVTMVTSFYQGYQCSWVAMFMQIHQKIFYFVNIVYLGISFVSEYTTTFHLPYTHTHSLVYIQLFKATGKYCIGLCMIAFTMEWEFPDVLAIVLTNRWVKLGFCIVADLKTCSWFISWQMSADSSKRQLTYYALWKMGNDRRAIFSCVENIISQGVTILDIAWHAALEIWTNFSNFIEFYIWRRITDCLLQSDCPMQEGAHHTTDDIFVHYC